jgi:hypothetical protein
LRLYDQPFFWRYLHEQEKPLQMSAAAFKIRIKARLLKRFGYVPGANATSTSLYGHYAAIFYGPDLLQVRIPDSTSFVVGVAHIVTEAGAFSTNVTFS